MTLVRNNLIGLGFLLLLSQIAWSQQIRVVRFGELEKVLRRNPDTLYVVNFWATWCAPCIRELPYFERLLARGSSEKMQVLLVSLDDKTDLNRKVKPFIQKRQLKSRLFLLDEPDLETWVDRLAPEWSGALPMTILLRGTKRKFIGKAVEEAELQSLVQQF